MADCKAVFPKINRHPYRIIAFDWDGTAVKNRQVDASEVTADLEDLLRQGVQLAVITGTNFQNIDRQFCSLIQGAHKQNLFVCANRGSEVFGFNERSEPVLLFRREASAREDELLSRVAKAVQAEVQKAGISIAIVYDRLNRRKIDLIPEWENPPKSRIGELLKRTERRLKQGGFAPGIKGVFELAERYAAELGLADARITSDVKHVEVGLTDKSDSMRWVAGDLAKRRNTPLADILVLGDEFGPVAGFAGSDYHTVLPELAEVQYLSVGKEPNGVPAQVLLLGGGPACFRELMRSQAAVNHKLALSVEEGALLEEEGYNPLREREVESLFAVGNGYLGTRGSLEEQGRSSSPATLIAGVYDRGDHDIEELVLAPDWLFTRIYVNGKQIGLSPRSLISQSRKLDLHKGLFFREWRHRDSQGRVTTVKFLRFASLADPHTLVLRITVVPENYREDVRVETGIDLCEKCRLPMVPVSMGQREDGVYVTVRTRRSGITVAMAQSTRICTRFIEPRRTVRVSDSGAFEEWRWPTEMGQEITIEKYVSVFTSRESGNPESDAGHHLQQLLARGCYELELDHIDAWQRRWANAAVAIEGDSAAQLWLNFAIYHLVSAGNASDERVSISARALTGTIYQGHIFWDTEIFILPFFISTDPATARAALMYRYHTLPAARKRALLLGFRGVLFSWESAATGEEMTPQAVLSPTGEVMPIFSGKFEQHINAAVAYAVWSYWLSTQDDEFLIKAGAALMMETARFWACRAERRQGKFHILEVEGPDEYHSGVNDNAYTNMMAAWNIRKALELSGYLERSYGEAWSRLKQELGLTQQELKQWQLVADHLYRGLSNGNGIIEQFQGYFALRDIDVQDFEPRTAPLDVILGRERTEASQVVKQADVVMALYLLEDELSNQAIRENFDYYDHRTGHGSSLSPSIYGLVAARLGFLDKAAKYFRQASTVDLANNMGNAAGGVHIASLGGLWQELIMGFAGVRLSKEGVACLPHLPGNWRRLSFSLLWRKSKLSFAIEPDKQIRLEINGPEMVKAGIFGRPLQPLAGGKAYLSKWRENQWNEFVEEAL